MLKFWKKKPVTDDEKAATSAAEAEGRLADGAVPPGPVAPDGTAPVMPAPGLAPDESRADPAGLQTTESDAASGAQPDAGSASWRNRLGGSGFARGISSLFARNPVLDDALLDELETCLISADVGVAASSELIDALRKRVAKREFANADALMNALREHLVALLQPVAKPLDVGTHSPFVILVVGVNGAGKTTTIGKLAHRLQADGRSILLAAGDTFRAAAIDQLRTWGERNKVAVIAQGSGSDSASVIFDALQAARARSLDVMIADTAGRLHTQSGLMDELAKIRRVLGKLDAEAPHEVLLVIDGTTGQNAISQVRQFQKAIGVTGLVVTKLDGTARGGVVFALAREFGLPIRHVGLGEGVADLRAFDARAFVDGLLPERIGAPAGE